MSHESDILQDTARNGELKMARVYVSATVEALVFDAAITAVMFWKLGFSSFSFMQAIGIALFVLFCFSVVIWVRKKSIRKEILGQLEAAHMEEKDIVAFLKDNPTEYEFVHALFIKPPKSERR
ncbi:MAG: hypothetical protein IJU23_03690 [Proteobacteria bacterium]|nr:hypothetical protein [Pseudomonadota bacterium]